MASVNQARPLIWMSLSWWSRPLDHPIWALICCFALWKTLLLCIAYASPGPGYDSSTHILLQRRDELRLAQKLARWDAIYFAALTKRDYLFEQEWAFGWGFTRTLKLLSHGERVDSGRGPSHRARPDRG